MSVSPIFFNKDTETGSSFIDAGDLSWRNCRFKISSFSVGIPLSESMARTGCSGVIKKLAVT